MLWSSGHWRAWHVFSCPPTFFTRKDRASSQDAPDGEITNIHGLITLIEYDNYTVLYGALTAPRVIPHRNYVQEWYRVKFIVIILRVITSNCSLFAYRHDPSRKQNWRQGPFSTRRISRTRSRWKPLFAIWSAASSVNCSLLARIAVARGNSSRSNDRRCLSVPRSWSVRAMISWRSAFRETKLRFCERN